MPMVFSLLPSGSSPLGSLPRAATALVVGLRGWVWGWRAAARGDADARTQWDSAWNTFAASLGPSQGRVATGTMAAFVAALAAGARRPLDVRPACCARLSGDERALLALVQCAARRGSAAECHARAIWLVRGEHAQPLIVHASDLGQALTATGLEIGTAAPPEALVEAPVETCQDGAVPLVVPPLSEAGD